MTLQHTFNQSSFHVWQRTSTTILVYRGQVLSENAGAASNEARRIWGEGRYQIRSEKYGRILLSHA